MFYIVQSRSYESRSWVTITVSKPFHFQGKCKNHQKKVKNKKWEKKVSIKF